MAWRQQSRFKKVKQDKLYVTGLTYLSVQYSDKYNKIVYILGERHNKEETCPDDLLNVITAKELFFKLLNSCTDLMDVYLEEVFNAENEKGSRFSSLLAEKEHIASLDEEELADYNEDSGYMEDVIGFLSSEGCLSDLFDSCALYKKHIRFHLSDIRSESLEGKTPFADYIHAIFELSRASSYDHLDNIKKYIKSVRDAGRMFDSVENVRTGLKDMLENYRINKQLDNVIYPEVKDLLNNITINYMLKMEDKLVWSNIRPYIKKIEEDIDEDINFQEYITDGDSVSDTAEMLMDIFLISRIFRTFKDTPGKLNGEPTNIIIYVGAQHGSNYRRILSSLGFRRTFTYKRYDDEIEPCLDITNLKIGTWLKPK
jgi:hypothetical protein